MSAAENAPDGPTEESARYVCRSPGCLSNALTSDSATWIGGGAPRQEGSAPEVLGGPREPPRPSSSPTTWLGSSSYTPEPPRRSTVRESRPSVDDRGHEFEDGVCLHCGRVERLAGRFGWSCPVRLP